jgi:hypothetical protein
MSDAVHAYSGKGGAARLYSLPQPAPILCMQLLATRTSRMAKCLIVALADGAVGFLCLMGVGVCCAEGAGAVWASKPEPTEQ